MGFQVIDAKTPQAIVGVEGEDARIDNRCALLLRSPSINLTDALVLSQNVEG